MKPSFSLALLVSAVIHGLVLALDVIPETPSYRAPVIDVMLVKPVETPPPAKPEALAQVTQRGGSEIQGRPTPPPSPPPQRAHPPKAQRPSPRKPTVSASALIQRSLDMAQLSDSLDRSLEAFRSRKRERYVTANTREHLLASYMEAWRRKVERIGNLNYPEEARRRGLRGELVLDVALNPDGTVASVTLLRPSGYPVLDKAAKRIVELASPFAPFPEALREKVDILHIIRTWRFEQGRGASLR